MTNKKNNPGFIHIRCLIIGAVVLMLLFSGCGLPRKQARTVHYYTLSYDAPKASETKTAAVIDIKPVTVLHPYDSRRIVYTDGTGLEQAFYHYHMWAANPADIVFSLIARDIRQSGIAAAVINGPSELSPTHTVEIIVNRFYEQDGEKSWSAVLSLTARLVKENPAGSGALIFEKTYTDKKMLDHKNPDGLARAMSKCLSRISGRMIKDIALNLDK